MAGDRPTRSTRFPEAVDDEFEMFRDVNDMSNSEALRELVKTGLEEKKKHPLDDRPDTRLAGLLWDARRDIHTFVLIAVLSLAAGVFSTGLASSLFLAVAAGYGLTIFVGAVDALVLDRGLTLRFANLGRTEAGSEVER
jgi:hypothetical protein